MCDVLLNLCCSAACARARTPSAVVPLITCTLASGSACVRAMGAGAAVCGVAGVVVVVVVVVVLVVVVVVVYNTITLRRIVPSPRD